MDYIKNENPEIENSVYLASGPAFLGTMLDYIRKIKEDCGFEYKASFREKTNPNIAYSWASNFMIGIDLCTLTKSNPDITNYDRLELTESGELIYNLIKDVNGSFDSTDIDPISGKKLTTDKKYELLKQFIDTNCPDIIEPLREIVSKSIPYRNLLIFFINNKLLYSSKVDFYEYYWKDMQKFYDNKNYTPNTNTDTTTAKNRVTPIVQICEFLGLLQNNFTSKKQIRTTPVVNNKTMPKVGNKVYYGAPGTGKSNHVNETYYIKGFTKRITLHPEYTYNDFVGYIKPQTNGTSVSYNFEAGPFTDMIFKALSDPDHVYTLIIEELNRANTASVFGDLFQLLDRNSAFESEYKVYNKDIYAWIQEKAISNGITIDLDENEIYIPSNLNLIATMNTSDQNVFTMDTAFKRRWEFEYIPIEFNTSHPFAHKMVHDLSLSWKEFVTKINKFMLSDICSDLMISEDKQIGPFFVKEYELTNSDKFAYKLLLYLWDDVFYLRKEILFKEEIKTFADIVCNFKEDGKSIFSDNFLNFKVL